MSTTNDQINPLVTNSSERDRRFKERCAPQTYKGSQTWGFHVHDIPQNLTYRTQIGLVIGEPITSYGYCTENNQCAKGLFCNKALNPSRCTPELHAGAPCCELNGGSCHDWCAHAIELPSHTGFSISTIVLHCFQVLSIWGLSTLCGCMWCDGWGVFE